MVLGNEWSQILEAEFSKPYFQHIIEYLELAYQEEVIYPPKELIFSALNLTDYQAVKVVIIGQDPYHGPEQAHGLSFSVRPGVKIPPSLRNIYKELVTDQGCYIPNHGSLIKWAEQGVLLINAVLTVRAQEASSHKKLGWQYFTDAIIESLNKHDTPIVFILWGNYAKAKGALITNPIHKKIESVHPSPLSASRGFFGCQCFSKCNGFLEANNMIPIDWQIENR